MHYLSAKMKLSYLSILFGFCLLSSCNTNNSESEEPGIVSYTTPVINHTITANYPHDTAAFTEGFLVHEGKLYESTGSPKEIYYTRSIAGPVNLKTGMIDKKIELDREKYFGEGITFLNGRLYQLTYQARKGFFYDSRSFEKLGEFVFPSKEGWGMTTDGSSLIMSDGTDTITYLDPTSFKVVKIIRVTNENGPVINLNELEFIKGFIYANVFRTTTIVKIDPKTGMVVGKLDFSSLGNETKIKHPPSLEMNGIAYDSTSQKVYVTGKLWPAIYEVRFNY